MMRPTSTAGSADRTAPGALVDSFTLPDVRGGNVALEDVLSRARAVIVFYRGGWCPLCNRQLAELSSRYEEFRKAGLEILAVSNEEVTQGRRVLDQIGPPFPLLLDSSSDVIGRLGLVVGKRDPLGWVLRKRGYAHPAVVIVDENRCIQWSYVGRTYRDRPSPDHILEAARSARRRDNAEQDIRNER